MCWLQEMAGRWTIHLSILQARRSRFALGPESSGLFFCFFRFGLCLTSLQNIEKLRSIFSSGVSFESEASLVLLLAPFAQGEPLPSSLCGEVVAWGSSELLLDAVVKRGCNVVDKVNLGALVAKLKGQRAVASEKAEALATREKDLKKRLLGGRGEEISELEKEALSNERKEIERLRSVAFLEKVLQACKIDDCSELVEARELVRTVTTEQPKVEAVTATPASEKETTEVTKARVGTNEDVFALSRRNLESSQDDLDEVCGDETLEKDPMVAYADIVLNEEVHCLFIVGIPCLFSWLFAGNFDQWPVVQPH